MEIPKTCHGCSARLSTVNIEMDGPRRDYCPPCWEARLKSMREVASDVLYCLNGLVAKIDMMATGGWSADQIARKLDRSLSHGMSVTTRLVEVLAAQRGIAFHRGQ